MNSYKANFSEVDFDLKSFPQVEKSEINGKECPDLKYFIDNLRLSLEKEFEAAESLDVFLNLGKMDYEIVVLMVTEVGRQVFFQMETTAVDWWLDFFDDYFGEDEPLRLLWDASQGCQVSAGGTVIDNVKFLESKSFEEITFEGLRPVSQCDRFRSREYEPGYDYRPKKLGFLERLFYLFHSPS